MNNYRKYMEWTNYGLFLVTIVLLPFPQILLRYACLAWWITWALEGRWLHKPVFSRRSIYSALPFILFGVWYAYKALSGIWAGDMDAWSSQMERYLTFGLLIPVGIWGVNERYDWRQAGKAFVISCIAAIPIYIVSLTVIYYHPEIVNALHLSGDWNVTLSRWSTFFSENISVLKHRLHFCSVELLGAIVAFFLYRKRWKILLPVWVVMLSSIPLTDSRQSVITAVAIGIVTAIYCLPERHRVAYGLGIILIGIMLGGGLLKYHPRMQHFNYHAITEMRTISYEHDVRFNIWGAALQHPEDYIGHGIGAGQSWLYMIGRYHETGLEYCAEQEYNCHNQYLEETIEGGILGLLLMLIAWFSIPFCARGKGRQTAWLFLVLFMLNMATECVFGRFDSVALWAIGMLLILLQSHPESEQ